MIVLLLALFTGQALAQKITVAPTLLWFAGCLIVALCVLDGGPQALADRFTYVPLLGIFVAFAWTLPPWPVLVPAAAAAVVAYALVTRAQLPVWHDATTLFLRPR